MVYKNKGSVFVLIPILLILIAILVVLFWSKISPYLTSQKASPTTSPIVSTTDSPKPTPTAVPTPTTFPSPTLISTPKATVKPAPPPVSGPPGTGYSTINVATEKGNFSASVLSIDLSSAKIVTDTGNDSDCSDNCTTLSLQDYVNRNGGFAGVNGTYFCPASYPECSSKKDSYDFPVYNSRLSHWINGGNLFWNSRAIVYFDGNSAHYNQNASSFGGGLTAGIVNYPGLVDGGNVQIDENQSGLSDKQKASGTKVGIGIRGSNIVMIVIARNVTMYQFAYVFKSLGATGALNLDTGGSTALYYNGKYMAGPGRNIPNAIIFKR